MFGPADIQEILLIKNGKDELTIVNGAALHGKNFLVLLRWLNQNIEFRLCKEVVLAKDILNNNILHCAAKKYEKTFFEALLEELRSLEIKFKADLLGVLLTELNNGNQTFIYILIDQLTKSNSEETVFKILLDTLSWIGTNTTVLENLLEKGDIPVVHHMTWKFKKEILRFLKLLSFSLKPEKILFDLDLHGRTLMFYIYMEDNENVGKTVIYDIFAWLEDLDFDLFEKLILRKDNCDVSFVYKMCQFGCKSELLDNLKTLMDYLERRIPDFKSVEFFKELTTYGDTILNYFFYDSAKIESVHAACEFLSWLKSIDSSLFEFIVYNEDRNGTNFINALCIDVCPTDLPNILFTIIGFLKESQIDFDILKLLKQTVYNENSFISSIVNERS